MQNIKDALLEHRADILKQLVELAAEGGKGAEDRRTRAHALVLDLGNTDKALSTLSQNGKYLDTKNAIDAIVQFLQDLDRPATAAEITDGVIRGGFRGGKEGADARANIGRSLIMFTDGRGKTKCYIKKIGTLYGHAEWEDGRFKSPR
ncbi:hypothetical protein H7849_23890 [Alloacidobacterium dinghuense]|uniref:Uncharacterized protein n=1 Tax=Alloacidobacterium dinghuense TaxID=2763107 RepID=A0A7G8BHJ7_9BACT|nr:hypothetical protein [Alloacidobacterium dinghuense]QNI32017.1 hypothetical protein H7849_23890 [Alloacidobacterium dinghuense]